MDSCNYCESLIGQNMTGGCKQCGAPVAIQNKDYTVCPSCRRKLLAMASLACNYCGKTLPADYIRTRQNVARAIIEQNNQSLPAGAGLFPATMDDRQKDNSLLGSIVDIIRGVDD